MKEFSDFEKKIIDKILELDSRGSLNVLGNILSAMFAQFGEYYIKVESENKCSVQIEFKYFTSILNNANEIDKLKEILEGTSKNIFKVVKLLEYLEKHDLVYISGNSSIRDIGVKIYDASYTDSTPFDEEICKLLYKYSSKTFLPSSSLYFLKNNNYLSEEEVRHNDLLNQYKKALENATLQHKEALNQQKKAIIISTIAICISLAAVFVSAFVTVKTKTGLDPQLSSIEFKIDQTEIKKLNETLESIRKELKESNHGPVEISLDQFSKFEYLFEMQEKNSFKNRQLIQELLGQKKAQPVNKPGRK